jgi:hypothetical protein
MAITARTNLRGRLGVLIAGSLVVTALTAGTAAASVPTPMGMAAPSRPGSARQPAPAPVPAPRSPGSCWSEAATPASTRQAPLSRPTPWASTTAG